MAANTQIAWTQSTWNPVLGCRRVSSGCTRCYAERMAHRLAAMGQAEYAGLTQITNGHPQWTGVFRELPDRLDQPLRWKKPRRVFVNSMSDLFGEGVSAAFIRRVFATMAQAPQHQFQILTKRPERMKNLLTNTTPFTSFAGPKGRACWPLPNVWLGVSVEDQATADARIPLLLQTPAAVRFLSCEPLLASLELWDYLCPKFAADDPRHREPERCSVDWVIVGAESGAGARPMDLDWVRRIRDDCSYFGTPLFFKQAAVNGRKIHTPELDGRRWMEYPETGGGQ